MEFLKRINPLTMLALIASVVFIAIAVHNGWTAEQLGVVAGALVALTSQLDRLFGSRPTDPPAPPPGAIILPFAVGVGLVLGSAACVSSMTPKQKAAAAEAEYSNELARCVDAERVPRTDQERLAAWERVDACTASVRTRWGIHETITTMRKDGGR